MSSAIKKVGPVVPGLWRSPSSSWAYCRSAPPNPHTGCIAGTSLVDQQIVGDNAGDDVPLSVLRQHATLVAEKLLDNLSRDLASGYEQPGKTVSRSSKKPSQLTISNEYPRQWQLRI